MYNYVFKGQVYLHIKISKPVSCKGKKIPSSNMCEYNN